MILDLVFVCYKDSLQDVNNLFRTTHKASWIEVGEPGSVWALNKYVDQNIKTYFRRSQGNL